MRYLLEPIGPDLNYPTKSDKTPATLSYDTDRWEFLRNLISKAGVRPSVLPDTNEGYVIAVRDCKLIAEIIRNKLNTLKAEDRDWLTPHIRMWKSSGGFRVF